MLTILKTIAASKFECICLTSLFGPEHYSHIIYGLNIILFTVLALFSHSTKVTLVICFVHQMKLSQYLCQKYGYGVQKLGTPRVLDE